MLAQMSGLTWPQAYNRDGQRKQGFGYKALLGCKLNHSPQITATPETTTHFLEGLGLGSLVFFWVMASCGVVRI